MVRITIKTGIRPFGLGLVAILLIAAAPAAEDAGNRKAAAVESDRFSPAQRDRVRSWIRELVPECPRPAAQRAVEGFLEELQQQSPSTLLRLMSPDFAAARYHSMVLRHVGAQLIEPVDAGVRAEVARQRIQRVLALDTALPAEEIAKSGAGLVAKIREMPAVHWKRLVEGKTEDDELLLLLKRAQADGTVLAKVELQPKVLTVVDIVSEYRRRNQDGAALQRFRAMTIQAKLETAAGEQVDIVLSKMRPDRFRMTIQSGGASRVITAFDGRQYWQHANGQRSQTLTREQVGALRYLSEFVDLLFENQGVTFERLEDRASPEGREYRVAIKRSDGSSYVSSIEMETFRQVGREMEDKTIIRYSDFRSVNGLTVAFREDSTDAQGRKNILSLSRLTPNPGLIQSFFEPRGAVAPGFFDLERMIQPAAVVAK